jgi:hypothetical protein
MSMNLGQILEDFGTKMKDHIRAVDAEVAARLASCDLQIHQKWEAVDSEIKALEAMVATKTAELAAVEARIADLNQLAAQLTAAADAAVPAK